MRHGERRKGRGGTRKLKQEGEEVWLRRKSRNSGEGRRKDGGRKIKGGELCGPH